MNNAAFEKGFREKCASLNIDADLLLKEAGLSWGSIIPAMKNLRDYAGRTYHPESWLPSLTDWVTRSGSSYQQARKNLLSSHPDIGGLSMNNLWDHLKAGKSLNRGLGVLKDVAPEIHNVPNELSSLVKGVLGKL